MSELGPTFTNVAPLAAQLGLDFRETAAVMAVMTQQGFDAGKAFTALRSALVGAQRDPGLLQKALKDPIVAAGAGRRSRQGLAGVPRHRGFQKFASLLRDYSERSGMPLIKLLGRIEGVQAILGVTGAQAEKYNDVLGAITEANGNAAEQALLLNDNLMSQAGLSASLFGLGESSSGAASSTR